MPIDIEGLARELDDAARERQEVGQITARHALTLEQAYAIQHASISRRHARGERPVGVKLGFTSRAKMAQMGVDSLIWGLLTDRMLHEEGACVDLDGFIHPRVEPEVCFVTRRDITGPLTLAEAAGYLEGVAPALEIIDSRYRDFRFTLEDVVADNCSSAGLVVGQLTRDLDSLDRLGNRGVLLRFNGRVVQAGSTAAILGHPLRCMVQISQLLARHEMTLSAGSLVMAGAATAAESCLPQTHVAADIAGLGRVEFTTGGQA